MIHNVPTPASTLLQFQVCHVDNDRSDYQAIKHENAHRMTSQVINQEGDAQISDDDRDYRSDDQIEHAGPVQEVKRFAKFEQSAGADRGNRQQEREPCRSFATQAGEKGAGDRGA